MFPCTRPTSTCGLTCSASTKRARTFPARCSNSSMPGSRLTPVTADFCRRTIREVSLIQKDLHSQLGTNFAFLGDEIYLRAGHSVPARKHYGDLPQIEDGVGMVRSFMSEFETIMRKLDRRRPASPEQLFGTIMTGTLFASVLQEKIARLNEKFGA